MEIDDADSIFHTVYDLDDRYQVPGEWAIRRGTTYRNDGAVAHWRGIYDDQGPRDGGHVVQFRYRRLLGVGRRSGAIRKNIRRWESASASTT